MNWPSYFNVNCQGCAFRGYFINKSARQVTRVFQKLK
uniref:Uncharacterized protein n=1 Tax=Anguilla anguilla TaxID=7936 RepID=A0A0E9PM96_ANGAN